MHFEFVKTPEVRDKYFTWNEVKDHQGLYHVAGLTKKPESEWWKQYVFFSDGEGNVVSFEPVNDIGQEIVTSHSDNVWEDFYFVRSTKSVLIHP